MLKYLNGWATNIASAVGGMAIVFGEIDDAPGLGGIGIILIVVSMYLNYKVINFFTNTKHVLIINILFILFIVLSF